MWDTNLYKTYNRIRYPFTSSNSYNEHVWLKNDTTHVEILEPGSDVDRIFDVENDDKDENLSNQFQTVTTQDWFKIYKEDKERMSSLNGEYSQDLSSEVADNNNIVNEINPYNDNNYRNLFTSHFFTTKNKFDSSDSSWEDEKVTNNIHEGQISWIKDDSNQKGEMLTFDEETNKHTVWIYSFQNKDINTDDPFELINVPTQDTSSSASCSLENTMNDELVSTIEEKSHRVSSPIPSAYIPRLDLIVSTLPTITEITEPEDNNSRELGKRSLNDKNDWFDKKTNELASEKSIAVKCYNSNLNIINSCPLPRDKKRFDYMSSPVSSLERISKTSTANEETKKTAKMNIVGSEKAEMTKKLFRHDLTGELILIQVYDSIKDINDYKIITHRPDKLISNRNEEELTPIKFIITDSWMNEIESAKCSENHSSLNDSEKQSKFDISTTNTRDTQSNTLNDNVVFENSDTTHTIPSLQLSTDSELEPRSCLNSFTACFKCCI